ncbi:hypothetical protein HDU79_007604 [Rhizoclosmatium sp. JEL0117]|nr:hypothetical protein HDU79_007604 [Rhizoclosmatium sp. JEL0117]
MKQIESVDGFSEGVRNLKATLSSMTEMESKIYTAIQDEADLDDMIASKLLLRLSHKSPTDHIVELLSLLEGSCLIHYKSKHIFRNIENMEKILSLLKSHDPKTLAACIDTLESILLDSSEMHRLFEGLGGLQLISNLITSLNPLLGDVKLKSIELLVLYMSPEHNNPDLLCTHSDITKSPYYLAPESKVQFLTKLFGQRFVDKLVSMVSKEGISGGVYPDVAVAAERERAVFEGPVQVPICKVTPHHMKLTPNQSKEKERKQVVIGNGPRGPRRPL